MNSSLRFANLVTHIKILLVALAAATVFVGAGLNARTPVENFTAAGTLSVGLPHKVRPESTRLSQQIDASREIRQALARPVPSPGPLLPITHTAKSRPRETRPSISQKLIAGSQCVRTYQTGLLRCSGNRVRRTSA